MYDDGTTQVSIATCATLSLQNACSVCSGMVRMDQNHEVYIVAHVTGNANPQHYNFKSAWTRFHGTLVQRA